MSEGTMVVTAPVVSAGGTGGYGGFNPGGTTSVPPGQAQAMAIMQISNGGAFDPLRGKELAKKGDLKGLLAWCREMIFFDQGYPGPNSAMAYMGQTADWKNFQISDMNDRLSGGPYSVVSALANFLWGNGRTMDTEIGSLGLKLTPDRIKDFDNEIMSMSAPGVYNFNYKFSYDTGLDNISAGLYLGYINLRMEGKFTRKESGEWLFVGNVRSFQDTYDFNPSTHRSLVGEALTTIGNFLGKTFNGKDYKININGQLTNIKLSGH
ncbi:lipid II-degrading bacteriocin [Erwinia sp. V90_4]|jgi:hypothetical protein|uniref:lipid II-degrading bacteriocin n=1 Tax=Erwinia TaxID=551 RepID=UPI000789F569|nr:lipid II-degrading bacteriocin [Erwinia sp. V90_4]MDI3441012.1 lipid II-degrading bacteriocin [Erwinia sp. V90_4]